MDIKSIQASGVYQSFMKGAGADGTAKRPSQAADSGDKLEVSSKAADLYDASVMAKKSLTPDEARAAKIADIKNRIENGTYSVPSRDVAASMLVGTLFDRTV